MRRQKNKPSVLLDAQLFRVNRGRDLLGVKISSVGTRVSEMSSGECSLSHRII